MTEEREQPLLVVEGDPDNLKVTHAEDLVLAEHLLARRRRGGRV